MACRYLFIQLSSHQSCSFSSSFLQCFLLLQFSILQKRIIYFGIFINPNKILPWSCVSLLLLAHTLLFLSRMRRLHKRIEVHLYLSNPEDQLQKLLDDTSHHNTENPRVIGEDESRDEGNNVKLEDVKAEDEDEVAIVLKEEKPGSDGEEGQTDVGDLNADVDNDDIDESSNTLSTDHVNNSDDGGGGGDDESREEKKEVTATRGVTHAVRVFFLLELVSFSLLLISFALILVSFESFSRTPVCLHHTQQKQRKNKQLTHRNEASLTQLKWLFLLLPLLSFCFLFRSQKKTLMMMTMIMMMIMMMMIMIMMIMIMDDRDSMQYYQV